jgi:hypothetical protein
MGSGQRYVKKIKLQINASTITGTNALKTLVVSNATRQDNKVWKKSNAINLNDRNYSQANLDF